VIRVAAVAVVVIVLAGCGGSPEATVSHTSGAVSFSRCMRSHGVLDYPDPNSSGVIPKVALTRLGVSSSQFQSAQHACAHLLPNGGRPTQAVQQQVKEEAVKFSKCIRRHGIPGFPDPGSDGRIPDPASSHIDQGSPQFERANQACSAYRPPYMPSNADYNAWARSHGQ